MTEQKYCIVCGQPTTGLRCRKHHGEFQRQQALIETAVEDRRILTRQAEGARRVTLALEFGISRVQMGVRIRDAKRREELRSETKGVLPIPAE